jgi:PAS domain S-box-containing protein
MEKTAPLFGGDDDARSIAEAIPHIVWVARTDGTIAWFNGRWYEYTGLAEEQSLGMQWAAAIHHEDIAGAVGTWTSALHAHREPAMQIRLQGRDGSYRWFVARAVTVPDPSGRVARWVGTCTDIDEQVRAEAARSEAARENTKLYEELRFLAQAGEALAESLRLETILERLAHLIVASDMAELALIDLIDGERITVAAVAHVDPERQSVADRLRGRMLLRPEAEITAVADLRASRPLVVPFLDEELLTQIITEESLPDLSALAPHSIAAVPLRSRGRTLGAIVVYWAQASRERAYTHADVPRLQELARRAAVAIENAQLFERESQVARAFQRAALPTSLPVVPGIAFDAVYQPATNDAQIGGDWYDALRLADGRVVLSIGDVAGSGLEASVIMAAMRQVIRGVMQVYADPATAIEAADRTLKAEHPNRFVTAVVAVYDPVVRELTFLSAGHPAPLLRSASGRIAELAAVGLPLGLRDRAAETPQIAAIGDGDLLVLYTDGLTESTRDVIEGERRVRAALADPVCVERADPAHAVFEAVLPDGATDDVVVFTTRFAAARANDDVVERWTFDARDAATARAARMGFTRTLRERCRFDVDDAAMAELVFGELLSNVVRYAPGAIEIVLDRGVADAPVLHVLDRGPGFIFVPRLPSDILSERGRGLFLIFTLTEEINVTRRAGGGAHARAVLVRR